MSIEVQNIPSNSRGKFNSKIREYKSNVDRAQRDLKQMSENADRKALFGNRDRGSDDIALDQRQQLLGGTASLDRSSQRLRDSQRIATETESIGANILGDLRGQREQIVNSRNTLTEADGYVDKSIRTLRGMARRMATNRIITIAIITILVILIFLVIASKFW
jgi:vesicle transport through interaction with t-SNAREs protein 1